MFDFNKVKLISHSSFIQNEYSILEQVAYIARVSNPANQQNTLTFVAIHELSHIMSNTIGHHQDFWQHFKFLLENAKDAGIYKPVDYKKKPESYCGMTITDNPYYDL